MTEYGLIGFPLEHSFSKKYFTEKFEREGLKDHSFSLFPLEFIGDLSLLLRDHPGLKGLAVTIPYKEQVRRYLATVDEVAAQTGAVNCISIRDGILTGFNTDVIGFERSFTKLLQQHHRQALILGTGGSSKAVQYVLKKMGIPFLVVTRNEQLQHGQVNYNMIDADMLKYWPVIINCTPAGMYPAIDQRPAIPYHLLSSVNYLFDLIYNPSETLFLKEGRRAGAVVKNGYEMLEIQAEENWRIWNGN